jgi:hypothetical protein
MTKDQRVKTFQCGKHSGFPLCCIFFFIYVWEPTYINSYFHISGMNNNPKYQYSFTRLYNFLIDFFVKWRGITHTYFDIEANQWICFSNYGRLPCPWCLLFSKKHHTILPCQCRGYF